MSHPQVSIVIVHEPLHSNSISVIKLSWHMHCCAKACEPPLRRFVLGSLCDPTNSAVYHDGKAKIFLLLLCCPLPNDRKMRKNRVGFLLFVLLLLLLKMSDLGEEFAKICIQWPKKALVYILRFDCIPPEFSPFRNFKKNIGKLNSLTVRKKKKKKKKLTDRPNFQILVGWGQHNNFFFLA